jgi:hypothetical protein
MEGLFMYAIYLKCPSGRFHPISLPEGITVNRLLFASLWQERQQAEKVLQKLQAWNADAVLQVRKVGV